MRTLPYALLSVAIVAGGILANACSSQPASSALTEDDQTEAPDPPVAGGSKTTTTTSPPPATDTDAGTVVDPDAGVPAPDADVPPPVQADCSATTSYDACGQCCDANNPPGYKIADDAYLACVCQTPGVCAQACGGSLCAGGQDPSPSCEQCLGSHAAAQCEDAANAACDANPACVASNQCFDTSNCEQKP
jgi:hypothetical protein